MADPFCQMGDGVEDSNAEIIRVLITRSNKRTYTTPKGKNKQAGRQKTGAQSNIKQSNTGHSHDVRQRISTGLQTQGDYIGRQTRVTRETQLEPLKQ